MLPLQWLRCRCHGRNLSCRALRRLSRDPLLGPAARPCQCMRRRLIQHYLAHPQVTDKLQVPGRNNVFAIGDATDVEEVKLGYFAGEHGTLVRCCMSPLLLLTGGRTHHH